VFTAEGYGSDGLTPLGYVAGHTKHLKLGTRVASVTARSAVATAMTYQTLNHMSGGGRVIAGLGSSDAVTASSRDGAPWGKPAVRMRDYIAIMRQAFAGQLIEHDGREVSIPYRGPGAYRDSEGKSAPPRGVGLEPISDIPIMAAASYPRTITQTAEIADGWMPANFAPDMLANFKPYLEEGFARAGDGKGFDTFKIWAHVDVNVDNDVRAAMRPFKEYVITWSQRQRAFMEARGYAGLADRLRELLAPDDDGINPAAFASMVQKNKTGARWEEALDTVPDEYIDEGNWIAGPLDRVRQRIRPWFDCGITGLIVRYGDQFTQERMVENLDVFRVVAEVAGKTPRG
jgi:alkanesulfonate monooxygenase SsuD/methylene tetrahydromethanopterin reductase-like flavin-dependent oxidoreductase (luciferase family)